MTKSNTVGRVKIQKNDTKKFNIEKGRTQGDGLAPILFNISLHKIITGTKLCILVSDEDRELG